MEIKVLGSGCPKCKHLFMNAQEAIKVLGGNIELKYITDMQEIVSSGIMSTPALMINDKVVSMGRINSVNDIIELVKQNTKQ